MTVERVEKLSTCPAAVLLAMEGHLHLLKQGWTDESSCGVGYSEKAIVAYEGDEAVGVMTLEEQDWKNALSIHVGYVVPEHRRKGVYTRLWDELVTWAQEKGVKRITGTSHCNNHEMQAVAESLRRSLTWFGYEYRVPETPTE